MIEGRRYSLSDDFKKRIPFLVSTFFLCISLFLFIRGIWKYCSLWLIQLGGEPILIPYLIGEPLQAPLHFELFISIFIFIFSWLLSTKVKFYQEIKMRIAVVGLCFFGLLIQMLWNSSIPIVRSLIPFIQEQKESIFIENYALEEALLANTDNLMLFILSLPLVFSVLMILWLANFCNQHWKGIVEKFMIWEYKMGIPKLAGLFMSDEEQRKKASQIRKLFDAEKIKGIPLPDVELGPNVKTKEMVVQRGKDRTLNNLIIGAIGTGKTSALAIPIINQDLHHMTYMINNFRKYYGREDFHTEEIKGSFLNGISIIEPSKDLCDKVYKLVKAHGIPEESIFYIDPTNPNTPSINLFNQPVDKVAEMFTMVISGIGESQEFFFEQSQRSHLKHHIYLLKLHEPGNDLGFEHLIDMYNDAQLVARMHAKLKKTIPENIDEIEDRDERNHWKIVKGIDEWFNETYAPEITGFGANARPTIIKEGPYKGEIKFYDKKAEHVVGLRNILNDIASNILLRRVLFGKSNFDFDAHLEYGGILLVNTAKGELARLSDVLGKFILLALQNAVFRRKPNVSSYHHILCDEFPDYVNEDFKSFPAQSRKYKVIVTVIAQTVGQLSLKYGKDYTTTLISTLRNKFLYSDGSIEDTKMFSALFGEKIIFEESETDQEVSPLMENPMRRTGQSYQSKERAILTPSELTYQDAFVCAVKLVENNKPIPVQQIKANFVSDEEYKEAAVKVEEEEAAYWIKLRREFLKSSSNSQQQQSLLQDDIEKDTLPEPIMKRPMDEVQYEESFQPSSEEMILDQSIFSEPTDESEAIKTVDHSQVMVQQSKEDVEDVERTKQIDDRLKDYEQSHDSKVSVEERKETVETSTQSTHENEASIDSETEKDIISQYDTQPEKTITFSSALFKKPKSIAPAKDLSIEPKIESSESVEQGHDENEDEYVKKVHYRLKKKYEEKEKHLKRRKSNINFDNPIFIKTEKFVNEENIEEEQQ